MYGDLIALDKFLIRFQHIDICFFGKRFFKTTVITASHPRLQAYEGSTGYGPDTDLQEEFDENDSELETVARECIAENVAYILAWFNIPIDTEEAIRERDW